MSLCQLVVNAYLLCKTTLQNGPMPFPCRSTSCQAPLTSTPIGKPWKMVAIDIFNVPVSASGKCLLIVQDYFTKWARAIPLPKLPWECHRLYTLIKVRILRVFCLRMPLMHLRYVGHTHQLIIHKVMALLRSLIALFCNSSTHTLIKNVIGNSTYRYTTLPLPGSSSLLYRCIPHTY